MTCMLSAEMCVYTMFLAPFFSIMSSAKYSALPGAFACVSAQNVQNVPGVVDVSNNLKLMNYTIRLKKCGCSNTSIHL